MPQDQVLLFNSGVAALRAGRPRLAVELLQRALVLRDDGRTRDLLAQAHAELRAAGTGADQGQEVPRKGSSKSA